MPRVRMERSRDKRAARHPELIDAGFTHAMSVGELLGVKSFDFGEGIALRKAKPLEVTSIRELHDESWPNNYTRNPYETEALPPERKENAITYRSAPLPRKTWRYHVFTFTEHNAALVRFARSTILTRSRMHLGANVGARKNSTGPEGTRIFYSGCGGVTFERVLDSMRLTDERLYKLASEELEDMRDVFTRFSTLGDGNPLIEGMRQVEQLEMLPEHSPMVFLGYVAIIEAFLTHKPKPNDPYDSLTRQVKQKMQLVGRRARLPLPCELLQAGASHQKIWTAVYDYRSRVAHGTLPHFSAQHKVLVSPSIALEFTRAATVTVLRQWLEEPDLMRDLREC